MKRVWLYCRTAHDNGFTLDNQIQTLKKFAEQKELNVVGVTSETGSGLDFSRNGLKEIKKVAKSKKADMILTKNISRIGRESYRSLNFIRNIGKDVEFKTMDNFDDSQNTHDIFFAYYQNLYSAQKDKIVRKTILSS